MLRGKYNGMRVRPSMDQIVGLIENDPFKIRYPNRDASFIINSPYMLNMMASSGIDLEEQSMRQKKYMMQQLNSKGIVEDTVDDDDDFKSVASDDPMKPGPNSPGVGMLSAEQVRRENMFSRAKKGLLEFMRKQKAELYKVEQQEMERLRNEELLKQQLEQFRREEAERRAKAQQTMSSAISAFSAHPVAASGASSSSGFNPVNPTPVGQPLPTPAGLPFTITPDMFAALKQFQQGSLLVPKQGDIQIQYLQPGGQTAITPLRNPADVSMAPPVQTKRTASPPREAPKAKAKATFAPAVQKLDSIDYEDWEQLTKDDIYLQMINFHGYKGKFPDLDKQGLLDWLLENAKIRRKSTATSSSSSAPSGVKAKEKTFATSKITSRDYGHWKVLSKREIYEQLVKYYGRKEIKLETTYKQKSKE